MHDLVPQQHLGDFFSKRMILATVLAIPLGLISGFIIDYWNLISPDSILLAFSILFFFGCLAGLTGVYFISHIAEPKMNAPSQDLRFHRRLVTPFADGNFKRLIYFLAVWNFAVNLAAPFFTVYMLVRLYLPILLVSILVGLSQVTSLVFLRIWGRLTDRMSNKSVLGVSGILLLFCILGWTFTTLPTVHTLSLVLLIFIHILIGISTSGVTLAAGNITIKLSPKGQGTIYLAATSIINALVAGIAPILGGILADLFIYTELNLTFSLISPIVGIIVPIISIRYYDFLFIIAFLIGIYSIHRLAYVREIGEVKRRELLQALVSEVRYSTKRLSFLRGLRNLFQIPYISAYEEEDETLNMEKGKC